MFIPFFNVKYMQSSHEKFNSHITWNFFLVDPTYRKETWNRVTWLDLGGKGFNLRIILKQKHSFLTQAHPCFSSITIFGVKKTNYFKRNCYDAHPSRISPSKIYFIKREPTPATEHIDISLTSFSFFTDLS